MDKLVKQKKIIIEKGFLHYEVSKLFTDKCEEEKYSIINSPEI